MRNSIHGILVFDAPNNTIGGEVTGAGNLISANAKYGIYLYGTGADGNTVQGNLIGTDASGSVDLVPICSHVPRRLALPTT